jgi:hypothetical protein
MTAENKGLSCASRKLASQLRRKFTHRSPQVRKSASIWRRGSTTEGALAGQAPDCGALVLRGRGNNGRWNSPPVCAPATRDQLGQEPNSRPLSEPRVQANVSGKAWTIRQAAAVRGAIPAHSLGFFCRFPQQRPGKLGR